MRRYQNYDEVAHLFATRTTFAHQDDSQRTSLVFDTTKVKEFFDILPTKKKSFDDHIELHEDNKIDHSDTDATYHMMFYNDDEDGSSKKTVKEPDSSYEDLPQNQTVPSTQNTNLRKSNAKVDGIDYEEPDEPENMTSSSTTIVSNIETVTKITMKEKLRDKRRPVCSMLKLRQLNFNSPRTLPEVSIYAYID